MNYSVNGNLNDFNIIVKVTTVFHDLVPFYINNILKSIKQLLQNNIKMLKSNYIYKNELIKRRTFIVRIITTHQSDTIFSITSNTSLGLYL